MFSSCLLHYTKKTFSMTPLSPSSPSVNTNLLAWNLYIQQTNGDKTDLKLNICFRISQVPQGPYRMILLLIRCHLRSSSKFGYYNQTSTLMSDFLTRKKLNYFHICRYIKIETKSNAVE